MISVWDLWGLWLFSHERKVCNLNDHSNYTIWNCNTQCTHEKPNFGFAFQSGRRSVARVWVPCQSNMLYMYARSSRVLCFCTYAAHGIKAEVIRRSHTCSSAPKSQFRGQGIHTVILLRDLRDASLKNTSRPPFELHNSNYALQCNFAYTRSKIQSFEWSFKLRTVLH